MKGLLSLLTIALLLSACTEEGERKRSRINDQDENGQTLLIKTVLNGDDDRVSELLHNHGADPNIADSKGNTALHYASGAAYKHDKNRVYTKKETDEQSQGCLRNAVYRLIEYGADVDKKNQQGLAAIHFAASIPHQACSESIRALAQAGARLNQCAREVNGFEGTPLMRAAQNSLAITEQTGPRPTYEKMREQSGRQWFDHSQSIVRTLLDEGAMVDQSCGDETMTALAYAAESGNTFVAKTLIRYGANIDFVTNKTVNATSKHFNGHSKPFPNGWMSGPTRVSVLDIAVLSENVGANWLVDELLENKVSKAILFSEELSSDSSVLSLTLSEMIQRGHVKTVGKFLDAFDLIDFNKTYQGSYPLHTAIRGYNNFPKSVDPESMLDLLLNGGPRGYVSFKGVNVNQQDENGNTALHIALIDKEAHLAVAALMKKGADPNIQNNSGQTAMMAGLHSWDRSVRILDFFGAYKNLIDLSVVDSNEEGYLVYAFRKCKPQLAAYLIEEGMSLDVKDASGKTLLALAENCVEQAKASDDATAAEQATSLWRLVFDEEAARARDCEMDPGIFPEGYCQ
jgi:ankyrin repeat protein